jgi:drug/metabolite transporter (DMT)-like permease
MAVGTLLLFVHLLRGHAASTVGALLLLVPPVTAAASALTLGEALHPASLAGMLVASIGVGAVLRRESGTRLSGRARAPMAPALARPRG